MTQDNQRGQARLASTIAFLGTRLWIFVAAWFVIISVIRLSSLAAIGPPGYDGMLYREATIRWLDGGDPWQVPDSGAIFGAPPPTLLAMVPFAILPEVIARPVLLGTRRDRERLDDSTPATSRSGGWRFRHSSMGSGSATRTSSSPLFSSPAPPRLRRS